MTFALQRANNCLGSLVFLSIGGILLRNLTNITPLQLGE